MIRHSARWAKTRPWPSSIAAFGQRRLLWRDCAWRLVAVSSGVRENRQGETPRVGSHSAFQLTGKAARNVAGMIEHNDCNWHGAEVFGTAATQSGYGGTFPGCRMC